MTHLFRTFLRMNFAFPIVWETCELRMSIWIKSSNLSKKLSTVISNTVTFMILVTTFCIFLVRRRPVPRLLFVRMWTQRNVEESSMISKSKIGNLLTHWMWNREKNFIQTDCSFPYWCVVGWVHLNFIKFRSFLT